MSLGEETMLLQFFVVSFSLASSVGQTEPVEDSWYVAAVYEHNVILTPEPRGPSSRAAALRHMQSNLNIYEEQAALAALQVCSAGSPWLLFQPKKPSRLMFTSEHFCLSSIHILD